MSTGPVVVVKKGGVLTALVSGVFATLIALVLCGAGLGWYGLNVVDRKSTEIVGVGRDLLSAVPKMRESLPFLADGLDDHRAPNYREQLETSVALSPGDERRLSTAIVEVKNNGPETVTLLTGRVVVVDERGIPHEQRTYIATPFTANDDAWRGPLLPGSTRQFAVHVRMDAAPKQGKLEITDVRLWNRTAAKNPTTASLAETPATEPSDER